jgi:hypothetical protein
VTVTRRVSAAPTLPVTLFGKASFLSLCLFGKEFEHSSHLRRGQIQRG